ncbi:MAG: MiaB/RimO family radical SAM methylthiotransferase, partial [Dehalococcoidales bacterium]|nr:MiaB/RimO family radical SAM methylthiotransferase [Dehalococcoidales bacterium]
MKPENKPESNCVTVALETLGCKLNQSETELLARQLAEAGYTLVSPTENPDIYILNTCTVTHVADRKSRHLLRMARQRNPRSRIIALGCYADSGGRDISGIEGIDLIVGNESKDNLKRLLSGLNPPGLPTPASVPDRLDRTRSFIKAQDGCNNFCAYCIVPLVRGREKSLSPEQVINEIRQRVADGYQEIVLTGTEIGRYSYDGLCLPGLLRRILRETDIKRLRLSSLQPREIDADLIRLWEDPRLCRHFHLALQSGSETVLQRMGRHYSPDDFSFAAGVIRRQMPEAAVTTDVIVGFPGETDKEFAETCSFCRNMEFARIHVFPYSPRKGT